MLIAVRSDRDAAGRTRHDGTTSSCPTRLPTTLPDVDIDPDDDACIFYTSGTTGSPKGAQLTHRGSIHNILNIAYMTTAMADGRGQGSRRGRRCSGPADPRAGPPGSPVLMAPTPLFHVTACNCLLHPATLTGGTVVFMRRWDPGRALELIERERVTNFSRRADDEPRAAVATRTGRRATPVRCVGMTGGGAAVQPDLVDKIDKALKNGAPGHRLRPHRNARHRHRQRRAAVPRQAELGRPDRADPRRQAGRRRRQRSRRRPDVVGQLCVRGAVVIKGYLNRPEATADAIRDGWFNTGDIARIDDDGFVFIVDRAKDMVLRGGENVYCSEVEAAIYQHDAVAEAAVFGIPDDRLGEVVGAAIVLHPGATLDRGRAAASSWPSGSPSTRSRRRSGSSPSTSAAQRQRQVREARVASPTARRVSAPAIMQP